MGELVPIVFQIGELPDHILRSSLVIRMDCEHKHLQDNGAGGTPLEKLQSCLPVQATASLQSRQIYLEAETRLH